MAECLGCNSHETLDIVRRPKITPVHELGRYMRRLCDRWTLVGRLLPSNKMLKEALRLLWLESATTVPSSNSNLWAARGAQFV